MMMKKLIKKFKTWLIHKLGGYLFDDGYTATPTVIYSETSVKPVRLQVAVQIPPPSWFHDNNKRLQYMKGSLEDTIAKLAVQELTKHIYFVIEQGMIDSNQVVKCWFDVIPLVNRVSLADLFAEEETEKETKE